MKFSEMRNLGEDEIRAKLGENHEELFRLRLRQASHQLSNSSRMRTVKKDIARLMTRERQLELEKAATNE